MRYLLAMMNVGNASSASDSIDELPPIFTSEPNLFLIICSCHSLFLLICALVQNVQMTV